MNNARQGHNDPAESAAFGLVPRYLDVAVEPYDHSGRQAAVDALLHYRDGRVAAMEVTSAADDGRRQLHALLADKYETLPNPGEWTWSATVEHPRDLPELAERCGRIILTCEAQGIRDPHHAHSLFFSGDPDIAWLMRSSAELHGSPNLPKWDTAAERERPLFVRTGGRGGSVDESLGGFALAIEEVVAQSHVQKRVAKLATSEHTEKHLFLLIDDSAIPFPVFYALAARDVIPPAAPQLPPPVTHLWLLVTFAPWLFLITDQGLERYDRSTLGTTATDTSPPA